MHTCRENIARDGWHATGVLAEPGKPGYIYTTVKAAQASQTFYVDPLAVFS